MKVLYNDPLAKPALAAALEQDLASDQVITLGISLRGVAQLAVLWKRQHGSVIL